MRKNKRRRDDPTGWSWRKLESAQLLHVSLASASPPTPRPPCLIPACPLSSRSSGDYKSGGGSLPLPPPASPPPPGSSGRPLGSIPSPAAPPPNDTCLGLSRRLGEVSQPSETPPPLAKDCAISPIASPPSPAFPGPSPRPPTSHETLTTPAWPPLRHRARVIQSVSDRCVISNPRNNTP